MSADLLQPHPPGAFLRQGLTDTGQSIAATARALGVAPATLSAVVHGRSRVSAELALRLARYWGTTPQYWRTGCCKNADLCRCWPDQGSLPGVGERLG